MGHKVIKHITAMKGIACIGILLGHFIGLIKYSSEITISIPILTYLKWSPIIFNENFWLQLFFVVSGYLLAISKVDNIKTLITKTINRFLRLGFPIFFSYIIIYSIGNLIGFHASETSIYFINGWYQNAYTSSYTIKNVLLSPIYVLIKGSCTLNSPFWVLKEMFFASIFIYCYTYIKSFISAHTSNKIELLILDIVFLAISLIINFTVFTCFLGALVYCIGSPIYEELKNNRKYIICIYACAVLLLICQIIQAHRIFAILFFAILVLIGDNIKPLNTEFAGFLGKISFGIYSLHWPLICSLGSLIILKMAQSFSLITSLNIALLTSFTVTIILAILFNLTFERFSNFINIKLMEIIDKYLSLIFSKH